MYSFEASEIIQGEPGAVWAVWADPDRFPDWDPREERCELRGPFAVGSTIDSKQKGNPGGISTISAVEPGRRWSAESPLPLGRLRIDHIVEAAGDGHVRVAKRYEVTGPLTLVFRLHYGPRVLDSLPASFAALETETARRG